MKERSEGIRRIVLTISILLVIGWLVNVIDHTDGFQKARDKDVVIIIAGFLIAFLAPN